MHKQIWVLLLLYLPSLIFGWADWQSISTKHFRIYYKDNWEAEAAKVLTTMEYYRPYLEELTGNEKHKIPITIEDLGIVVNGYTDTFKTRIALFASPPTTGDLAVCEDWWRLVGSHEYIHMLQMTKESGMPKILRIAFSNYFYPTLWQPEWMTEGITVYGESHLSPYGGRLNGGTYPSIISALAKSDKLPSITKAGYYSFDTPQAQYYVFGGAFYEYLSDQYGEDKFARLFDKTSSSMTAFLNPLFPYFNLDKAFNKIYGKPISELWKDWITYEKRQEFEMPKRSLTSDGWFKSDLTVYNDTLYYVAGKAVKTGPGSSFFTNRLYRKSYPEVLKALEHDSTGIFIGKIIEPTILVEQTSDFPAGYHLADGKLYYSRAEWYNGFANNEIDGYGSTVQIWQQDLQDNKRIELYHGQIRSFLPLQDGSLIISEDNQTHTASNLYIINPRLKTKTVLLESNALISTILSNGDKFDLTMKNHWQNCGIFSFDPTDNSIVPLIHTPFYADAVSVNGDSLVFNAVFENRMHAYVYNMNSGVCYRMGDIDDVRSPVVLPGGETLFISLNAGGYDIYRDVLPLSQYIIPQDKPFDKPVEKSSLPEDITAQFRKSGKTGTYLANLGHMAVSRLMHRPIIEKSGDSLAVGISLSGNDVVGDFPFWTADLIYDFEFDEFKYSFTLENEFFRPVKHVLSYSNLDKHSVSSLQYLTLYRKQNYGLRLVTAGFSYLTRHDFDRKIWTPFMDFYLGWANTNIMTRQYIPYETQTFLPSDRDRLGWQNLFFLHQKLPFSSELKASVFTADDEDADIDEVFGKIRGYKKAIKTNKGAVIQASWYKPIFKIKEGLWNPQIYAEDVNLGLFCDAALPYPNDEAIRQTSYGLEIIAELGFAYYVRLNTGIRFSNNIKDNMQVQFFIDTLF